VQEPSYQFGLPSKLEKLLASLSIFYGQNNQTLPQKLLVNSKYTVDEAYESGQSASGDYYGHAIHFHVPSAIYFQVFTRISDIEQDLKRDLNEIAKCPGEYICTVTIEVQDDSSIKNWREYSGVLLHSSPPSVTLSNNDLLKIWEPGYFRVFISHKAEDKVLAVQLKQSLLYIGATSFVAHEDIAPTKEWQDEIEKALFSMDVLVPLLTPGFANSDWTDQETGIAMGRGVPVVPVRVGIDPYGFIGKYQAVSGLGRSPKDLADELLESFLSNPITRERTTESLVTRFERAETFNHANLLIKYLEKMESATPNIIERLSKASANNDQVEKAYEVQKKLPHLLNKLRGGD